MRRRDDFPNVVITFSSCRYGPEEIEKKVTTFRKMLMQKEDASDRAIEKDEYGRPM
jgi:hypothetical protein